MIKLISNFTLLFGAIDILIASTIIHEHINIEAIIIAQIAQTGGQKTYLNHQPPKDRNVNGLEVFAKCALYLNLVLIKLISNFTILFGAIDILIASTIIHEIHI